VKKATAAGFYRLMQRLGGKVQLPPDTGDFRLMSRRAIDALLKLREQHRFMRGSSPGSDSHPGPCAMTARRARPARRSGTTGSCGTFSLEGITSFTVAPLKVATYVGLVTSVAAVAYLAQLLFRTFFFGNPVAGYPSLLAVVLFLGGVQMMMLGIIGAYLGASSTRRSSGRCTSRSGMRRAGWTGSDHQVRPPAPSTKAGFPKALRLWRGRVRDAAAPLPDHRPPTNEQFAHIGAGRRRFGHPRQRRPHAHRAG
jgi:hypothetical protein